MPIRSTPPITMQQVLDEFNAPQNTPLSGMLKGGLYVPLDTEGGTIPTELPISLSDFLGAVRPASLEIASIEAITGSVSSVNLNGLTASATLAHASAAADTNISASASLRVNLRLIRATTPKVRLSVQAGNPAIGLDLRPYTTASRPAFDDAVPGDSNAGPSVTDVIGSKRGSWSMVSSVTAIAADNRIAGSFVLSNAAEDGDIVSFTVSFNHNAKGYIAGGLSWGQAFSHNALGGRANFALSVLFLNEAGDTIIQDVPIDVLVSTSGLLQAIAREFEP